MNLTRRSACALLGTGAALALLAKPARASRFFRIATGTTVGTYFPVGRVIASAITKPPGSRDCEDGGSCGVPGLIAVAHSTQGALDNIQLVGRGMVESGFAQADQAAFAYNGAGAFLATGPLERLRAIANLYPESLHVVVRREDGIRQIADLSGKRISIGLRESSASLRAEAILAAYGVGLDDVIREYHEPAQAAQWLRDRRIDAMVMIDGFPMPVIADLARSREIDLLPLEGPGADALAEANQYFKRLTIPAGTYRGIEARSTLAVGALWLTSTKLEADLIYAITQALWREGNRALLDGSHPMAQRIRLETAADDLTVPLHDGARRYYRERGLIL